MPVTVIIIFVGILSILFFSEYQSFRCHPVKAGWFKMPERSPLIVTHYTVDTMISRVSPFLTFKKIA